MIASVVQYAMTATVMLIGAQSPQQKTLPFQQTDLLTTLEAAGHDLGETSDFTVEVSLTEGVVEWALHIKSDSHLAVEMNPPKVSYAEFREARLTASIEMHNRLKAVTVAACEAYQYTDFNVDTDLHVDVFAAGGEEPFARYVAEAFPQAVEPWAVSFCLRRCSVNYIGDRIVYVSNAIDTMEIFGVFNPADEAIIRRLAEPLADPRRVLGETPDDANPILDIIVEPVRETVIQGSDVICVITVCNIGQQKISVPIHAFRGLEKIGANGRAPRYVPRSGFACTIDHASPEPTYVVLASGESRKVSKAVRTKPSGVSWDYVLDPGQWTIAVPDLTAAYNVRSRCRSAEVKVVAAYER